MNTDQVSNHEQKPRRKSKSKLKKTHKKTYPVYEDEDSVDQNNVYELLKSFHHLTEFQKDKVLGEHVSIFRINPPPNNQRMMNSDRLND